MNYEIVELKEKQVVGLIKRTANENMQSVNDIGLLWKEFISNNVFSNIENKINQQVIGLYTDYEWDCTKPYNFMTCCEVSRVGNLNASLTSKTINSGKYAKFSLGGNPQSSVMEAWDNIWKIDLNRKYDCDFEVYHNNSDDINDQIIDIYISIE